MATTHRSDLVDELEKALRDEAYDGGVGALMPAALAESDADEAEGGAGWDVEVDARTVLELLEEHSGSQGEPSDATHAEHVTVSWAYWGNCLEGDCEHLDEDGQPEDLSACPNVPPFEVCVDCMEEDGRGRDPEHWDDVPLIAWPCAVVTEQGENR